MVYQVSILHDSHGNGTTGGVLSLIVIPDNVTDGIKLTGRTQIVQQLSGEDYAYLTVRLRSFADVVKQSSCIDRIAVNVDIQFPAKP